MLKKCFGFIIGIIDQMIVKLLGWKHIPGSELKCVYFVPRKYKGDTFCLNDGTKIQKGDLVAEIHFDNTFFRKNDTDTRYANILRWIRIEIVNIKALLEQHSDEEPYRGIKAVYGNAMIYKVVARMGFTIIEGKKTFASRFSALWENILRLSFKKTIKKKERYVNPKNCWLSSDQIKLLW